MSTLNASSAVSVTVLIDIPSPSAFAVGIDADERMDWMVETLRGLGYPRKRDGKIVYSWSPFSGYDHLEDEDRQIADKVAETFTGKQAPALALGLARALEDIRDDEGGTAYQIVRAAAFADARVLASFSELSEMDEAIAAAVAAADLEPRDAASAALDLARSWSEIEIALRAEGWTVPGEAAATTDGHVYTPTGQVDTGRQPVGLQWGCLVCDTMQWTCGDEPQPDPDLGPCPGA